MKKILFLLPVLFLSLNFTTLPTAQGEVLEFDPEDIFAGEASSVATYAVSVFRKSRRGFFRFEYTLFRTFCTNQRTRDQFIGQINHKILTAKKLKKIILIDTSKTDQCETLAEAVTIADALSPELVLTLQNRVKALEGQVAELSNKCARLLGETSP